MLYWIWLSQVKGLSPAKKLELVSSLGDARQVYESGRLSKDGMDAANKILQSCEAGGVQILTAGDGRYPRRLLGIADPPLVLYYKGSLPDFDREAAIAVVGTRKASAYGLMAAESMGRQISLHGGLVVSGMAAGIDAQAGWGAVRSGCPTVGVLGGGVDVVYPASNRALYQAVEACGCLISEYPPGTAPGRWTFPQRNRIISGLSLAVLAVEAPEKSGTMITVRDAQKQGRDVFVVPGQIGIDFCRGTNSLLQEGAMAATCGWDILRHYAAQYPDKIRKNPAAVRPMPDKISAAPPKPAEKKAEPKHFCVPDAVSISQEERAILEALGEGELSVDQVIARTGLPAGTVLAKLTMLELKDLAKVLPGSRVIRNL